MTTEQKHTKGPWSASPCENGKEWGVDSGEWGIATCADYPGDGTPKANARRIVACVNACEDIPTGHLENFGLPPFAEKISVLMEENDALAAKVKELEAQRDDLISCLNVAAEAIDIASDWNLPAVQVNPPTEWGIDSGGEDDDGSWASTRGLADHFRATIAKIEAEKTTKG